jgi:hypothetical protein
MLFKRDFFDHDAYSHYDLFSVCLYRILG